MHIFYSRFTDSVFSVCVQGSKEKTPNTMSLGFTSKNLVLKVNFVPFHARSDRAPRDFYRSPYRSLISISSLDRSLIVP